jgi:hypothetical protein
LVILLEGERTKGAGSFSFACASNQAMLDHSRSRQSDITGDTHLRLGSDIT